MDCFGTYFTHVQSCDVTRVQSATQWTASVHTLHMSKTCFDTVHTKNGVSNRSGRKNKQKHCKTWDEIAKMKKNVRPSVRTGPSSSSSSRSSSSSSSSRSSSSSSRSSVAVKCCEGVL